jgi:transcriptional regulator with XRE-family HTH domain
MSGGELCDKLGIDRDDLVAYEHGAKRVNANLLLRVAELLDVPPDYFFQGYTDHELSACLEVRSQISSSLGD